MYKATALASPASSAVPKYDAWADLKGQPGSGQNTYISLIESLKNRDPQAVCSAPAPEFRPGLFFWWDQP